MPDRIRTPLGGSMQQGQAVLVQLEPSWKVWLQVSLGEVVEAQGRTEADKQAYC